MFCTLLAKIKQKNFKFNPIILGLTAFAFLQNREKNKLNFKWLHINYSYGSISRRKKGRTRSEKPKNHQINFKSKIQHRNDSWRRERALSEKQLHQKLIHDGGEGGNDRKNSVWNSNISENAMETEEDENNWIKKREKNLKEFVLKKKNCWII